MFSIGGWQRRSVPAVGLTLALFLVAGCHRDPNVRKQKYLESGQRYEKDGKYREAVIQFSNALKIDRNFGAAHYELGETYLKMHKWNEARDSFAAILQHFPRSARVQQAENYLAFMKQRGV